MEPTSLGFRAQCFGFSAWGLGGLGFRGVGLGFRSLGVWGLGFRDRRNARINPTPWVPLRVTPHPVTVTIRDNIKGFRLVPLGLHPLVLGSF